MFSRDLIVQYYGAEGPCQWRAFQHCQGRNFGYFCRNLADRDANQLQLQCLADFLVRTQRCVTIRPDIAIKSRTNRKFAS